jgi:hypothetical protein
LLFFFKRGARETPPPSPTGLIFHHDGMSARK